MGRNCQVNTFFSIDKSYLIFKTIHIQYGQRPYHFTAEIMKNAQGQIKGQNRMIKCEEFILDKLPHT